MIVVTTASPAAGLVWILRVPRLATAVVLMLLPMMFGRKLRWRLHFLAKHDNQSPF